MVGPKPIFLPIKPKRIFEEIANQIKELIYSGVFKPDDRLPSERELASQFQVGRMVVREALRVLEQSGLIYVKQGSCGGVFAKKVDTSVMTSSISDMVKIGNVTLSDLTEVRLSIEKIILELVVVRITDEELDLLSKNIEDTANMVAHGIRSLDNNIKFHLLMGKFSKNPLLEVIIESVMNVFVSFLDPLKPNIEYGVNVFNYHKAIYEAIKDKKLPMAAQLLEEHLIDVNKQLPKFKKRDKPKVPVPESKHPKKKDT
jgi:GntR family transcriptional regulator, transcriptional repressor for pyruvate dehydrogenase complex